MEAGEEVEEVEEEAQGVVCGAQTDRQREREREKGEAELLYNQRAHFLSSCSGSCSVLTEASLGTRRTRAANWSVASEVVMD